MDIRAYSTKDLPYHFVLFYNLTKPDMGRLAPANAILTYCYIDTQAGLTYEMVCPALLKQDGMVSWGKRPASSSIKFREGGLIGEALVLPDDGRLAQYEDVADRIKEGYGYHIEMIEALEKKRFRDRRHVCYPDDVLVDLYGMGMKTEQVWVTDAPESMWTKQIKYLDGSKVLHTLGGQMNELKFSGAGTLLNEPYNPVFGYRKGEVVPIYSFLGKDGNEIPIVPARGMLPK